MSNYSTEDMMSNPDGQQEASEAKTPDSVRMVSRLPGACGFVRLNRLGGLEVELYDRGELTERFCGGEVATTYTVAASDLPAMESLLLAYALTMPALAAMTTICDAQLPQSLADPFPDVEQLIAWLADKGIPFSRRVDTDV
ncbi:hypothetical protein RGU70_17420 [Herbaspirillum sp. RTI4]|uniref:hypothetical protein n=1 Tax=Herbaspirillum sp. RTI4 TaxID=3048640 RepID=UPI002AB3F675|nr:hypothetical protein [Herbaspirillum sp. RTI4]MDY7580092.1 hypothetical protein [Herbaspirillum sp. RTI4]MEA9983127.1 hypothetical protein [Herbaspirillum sp. RTI4]